MKKILFLAVSLIMSIGAWAEGGDPEFTFTSWTHEGWTVMNQRGSNVTSDIKDATRIMYSNKAFAAGSATFTIAYGGSGSRRGYVNGIELVQNDEVKYSVYERKANSPAPHAVYTIDNIEAGTYTIYIWGSRNTDNQWINSNANVTIVQGETEIVKQSNIGWNAWTTVGTDKLSDGLKAVCTSVGTGMVDGQFKYKEETVTFAEAGSGTVKYQYTGASGSGNERIDILGFEVLDEAGNTVVSSDAHYGYTGSNSDKNTYTYKIPAEGTYKVRTWLDGIRQPWSKGTVTYTFTPTPKVATFKSNVKYTIANNADNRGKLAYNPAAGNYVGLADVTYSGLSDKHPSSSDENVGIEWQIIEDPLGKVALKNLKNNKYASIQSNGKCVWSETPYLFVFTAGDGYFTLKGNGTPNSNYLTPAPGWNPNDGPVYLEGNTELNANKFVIEEVADGYTLEIGTTGFSTLFLGENVTIPEGVTVYYCTEEEEGKLTATAFDANDVIPANIGVVVKGTPSTSYVFPYTEDDYEGEAALDESALYGVWADTSVTDVCDMYSYEGDVYVLSVVQEKLGFYKYADTAVLKGNRAFYIPTSAMYGVQGFVIDFGGEQTTGIISVNENANANVNCFDLAGRRVNANVKGISIVNGKKIVK